MRAEPKKTTVSRTLSRRKWASGSRNSAMMRITRASGLFRNPSFRYATGRRGLCGGISVDMLLVLFHSLLQFAYALQNFGQFGKHRHGAQPLVGGKGRRA